MDETDTPRRRAGSRTQKRSRSGATHPCPHCGKKVRTEKAVQQHVADVHPDHAVGLGQSQKDAVGLGHNDVREPH